MNEIKHDFLDARILAIDDCEENVTLIQRILNFAGYFNVRIMTDSQAAMELLDEELPDIILLDLQMPQPDGFEILKKLAENSSPTSFTPVLVFTADATPETRKRALDCGASDFLTKPGDPVEILLRVRNFLQTRKYHLELIDRARNLEHEVKLRTGELISAREEALRVLAKVAEARDDATGEHTNRVGELSAQIATSLGKPTEFVQSIRLAAPLHDLGKIGIPDRILLKPGKLDSAELETMRKHTQIGAQMLSGLESPTMKLALEIVISHHEKWDGTGYPRELKGEQIPLAARIVAVADVYDALTHERPYKPAWSHEDAVAEIVAQSGKHFDPQVVDRFVALFANSV